MEIEPFIECDAGTFGVMYNNANEAELVCLDGDKSALAILSPMFKKFEIAQTTEERVKIYREMKAVGSSYFSPVGATVADDDDRIMIV